MPFGPATGTRTATAFQDFSSCRIGTIFPTILLSLTGNPSGVLFAVLLDVTIKAGTGSGAGAAPSGGAATGARVPVIVSRRRGLWFFWKGAHSRSL